MFESFSHAKILITSSKRLYCPQPTDTALRHSATSAVSKMAVRFGFFAASDQVSLITAW